ncbi:UNVERIFIED_ORG: ATP-grasp domain-containing protein [Bacillus cereus]
MSSKYCICVGRRESVLINVKKRGYKTIVLVDKSMPPPSMDLCDSFYHVNDITDINEISSILNNFKQEDFITVIASGEKGIMIAAEIRELYKIKGKKQNESLNYRDKYKMKKVVSLAGLKIPKCIEVDNFEDGLKFLEEHSKIIAKPREGMGSISVSIIKSKAEWIDYYNFYLKEKGLFHFKNGILLEEFIEGIEFHIDSVIQNNEIRFAYASMYPEPLVGFENHNFIGTIALNKDDELHDKLLNYNRQIIRAFNIESGVTHLECFLNELDDLVFCEIAIRPAGSSIPENLKLHTNVDLIDAFVGVECFEELTLNPIIKPGVTGSIQIPMTKNGKIKKLFSKTDISKLNGIIKVDYLVKNGDFVKLANASHQRIGDIYAYGPNYQTVLENLKEALNKSFPEYE